MRTKGLKILKVVSGGPAEKCGLCEGEYVQSLDGKWVTAEHKHFQQLISSKAPGETVASPCTARHCLYRLYIGIADGISIARVWACRYSK